METPSQDLMQCRTCKEYKPQIEMLASALKGKWCCCKACNRVYGREYRLKNKDKQNAYHRKWRSDLGDRYKNYLIERRKAKIKAMSPEELAVFRKKECDKAKRLNRILKNDVFMAYGGWKCACCGETEKSFLTIDHMLNDGAKLRREGVHGVSTMFYRWLKNSGYPKNFQVLCMNCQFGKRMNNGVCPHSSKV